MTALIKAFLVADLVCSPMITGELAAQTIARPPLTPAPSALFAAGATVRPWQLLSLREASTNPDSVHTSGATRGAVVGGAALGLISGMLAFGLCDSSHDGSCVGRGLIGILPGAVVGAVLGGMFGSL
jgi:hypothetical protein